MPEEDMPPQQIPHQMDESRYRKLFGLEIYLTPVFVTSGIAIIPFILFTD